jgi:hypothetical protein
VVPLPIGVLQAVNPSLQMWHSVGSVGKKDIGQVILAKDGSCVVARHLFLVAFAKLRKATVSFRHVCPSACNSWAPNGWISVEFYILVFFENLSRKLQFH